MQVGIIGLGNVGLAYGTVLTNYINENLYLRYTMLVCAI